MNPGIESALQLIDGATAGLSADELEWHPEGKWSSAQILEHLYLAFSGTVKGLKRQLEAPTAVCRALTARDRWLQLVVIKLGHMPHGRQAPEVVRPHGMPAMEVMAAIRQSLPPLDAAISDCERKFGTRARIMNHIILGPLTAAGWRKFHLVHTRHHMRQIHALLRSRALAKSAPA